MLNAVGYTRYSTDKQSENSTQYQVNAIKDYAKKHDTNILRFYSDEGYSGTNTDRPAFQELRQAAQHKLFDAVVIYDISRASRDVADWMSFRKRGAVIGKNSLNQMLRNERYIGIYTWNKYQYKVMRKWAGKKLNPNIVKIAGVIPPIIDMNTWERVQLRMNGKKNNARNKAKREYLLTGLIECEECGASYVGHTSTRKGHEYKTYICGNKYRTRECHAHNIKADTIESFVVAQLKQYFTDTDFNAVADEICNAVNSASNDLSAEKKELKDINAKINNGVTAVLNGLDLPELQDEIDHLRVRKSELEDIIGHVEETNNKKISKQKLIALMQEGAKTLDTDIKNVIKNHVTKIYAHADGSFTINIGVHLMDCGSRI